ncbi:MAG: hypothetical protein HW416_1603 [Chloroflexi bacterium]|nr:hypothetical protein [Chloroflexota bacterium]
MYRLNRTEYADIDSGARIGHGFVGGLIGGTAFALFAMIASAILFGASALTMPLRLVGSLVIGVSALSDSAPVTTEFVGLSVHLVLSAFYGMVFGLIAYSMGPLAQPRARLVAAAVVYGWALWLLNFYLIAPAAGWAWIPAQSIPGIEFLSHALFFGGTLGLYMGQVQERTRAELISFERETEMLPRGRRAA